MMYPNVDLESWILKYGLEVADYSCPNCGCIFHTTIPVLTKDDAGLQTPIHNCGPEFSKAIFTPRTHAAIEFWNKLFKEFVK